MSDFWEFGETTERSARRRQIFRSIEIWRREVGASRICCVCSAPTTQQSKKNKSNSGEGASTGAAPDALPSDEMANEKTDQKTYSDCPICASPTDGVEYKRLSKDGKGLVRLSTTSSRSFIRKFKNLVVDTMALDEEVLDEEVLGEDVLDEEALDEESKEHKNGKGKGKEKRYPLLKKVSQLFQRAKKPSLRLSSEALQVKSEPDTSAADLPTVRTPSPPNKYFKRRVGTEMYDYLRITEGQLYSIEKMRKRQKRIIALWQ